MAMARVLVSEADPDARRLLNVLIERQGHEAIALGADVVVPPRAELLLVDPVVPSSLIHARLVRELFPTMPILCLNPLPEPVGLPGPGVVSFLPKPFGAEAFGDAIQPLLSPS